ncbi:hypothetical protein QVD17_33673 [Tagetes erecta]|uniref:Leucine-rich repeat-containing N-terminal plant-type domain-containing protein n=1 Tax=Tagetes erecta TaxID=13708 RepID=A0AAD8NLE5_TARER|nr:hypothetical protein QVD17_33673 [Tagetes erecta]
MHHLHAVSKFLFIMTTQLSFHHFSIPFYLIFFGLHTSLVSGQCQVNEHSTLIQLKNTVQFDSSLSTKLVSWNPNATDCCNWRGVTCNVNGQVIGLDLSSETISTGIDDSSVLFNLKNLESLNLAANSFKFIEIPSRIGSLTGLSYLNLANSGFSGQIPEELSRLSRLEVLDLSNPNGFYVIPLKLEKPNLAGLVQNLTRLRRLYLDNADLSAQNFDWCRSLSSSLLNLEVMSLSNCQLSGPLDVSLQKLKSLSIIRLDENNLNCSVPDFFANYKNLTVMKLSFCNLSGTFPNKVLQLQKLQILDLSSNENLYGSLPNFPINGSLQTLLVSGTKFAGVIPESIGNLKNLSEIVFRYTNFSGGLPKALQNLTQLEYIDLSFNSLSGTIPSAHFQNLKNLVLIDLSFNGFIGSIPSSLFALQNLEHIMLCNNNFEGVLANYTNPSFSSLDWLDLRNNKLEGDIPKSIFELRKLSVLLLSSNNMSGTLSISDFTNPLTNLDLSFNNFSIITNDNVTLTNHLPKFMSLRLASCNLLKFPNLRNQSRLQVLDFSSNHIEGKIPNWIWEIGNGSILYMNLSHNMLTSLEEPYTLPNLERLDLHSNHLIGVIPLPQKSASFMDYSNNLFNSSLTESISLNLSSASFFSVANNLLTGVIPQSICNAPYLKVLDMSNNQLNGSIPSCLIELGNPLGVLNLANNSLGGRIEGAFPINCELSTLDVHGNSLEGEIPRSLVNCMKLRVLNLGNNMINDTYPHYLGNNTDLHVLVLRYNQLHGSVLYGQNQHNKWSKLQILDIAHNYFSGTIPADFFSQWDAMMTEKIGESKNHLNFNVFADSYYYEDKVTVTTKGLELELVKILTIFTSIDISNNQFSGEIPRTIGQLKALYILNVSHNNFTGSIPASLGNLSQLESLDMSSNKLTGEIPYTLANLTFLSRVNLSYNQLKGRIPTGSQLQTFENNSYLGNERLCGFPLTRACTSSLIPVTNYAPDSQESNSENEWRSIYYGFGFGAIISVLFSLWKGYSSGTSRRTLLI